MRQRHRRRPLLLLLLLPLRLLPLPLLLLLLPLLLLPLLLLPLRLLLRLVWRRTPTKPAAAVTVMRLRRLPAVAAAIVSAAIAAATVAASFTSTAHTRGRKCDSEKSRAQGWCCGVPPIPPRCE